MSDTSIKAGKKVNPDSTTQRYLPFSEIRDNVMIMKDGSSRMVIRVRAMNFNLKSTEEQDAILMSYQRFLNTLNFPIQIIVRSLKVDIEAYILKLKNLATNQSNPLLKEQTQKYIDFMMNLVDLAQIMRKDFYIVVPYDYEANQSVRKTDMMGIFGSWWQALNQGEEVTTIRANRRRVENLRKGNYDRLLTVKTALESIGLKTEEMKKDDLVRLLHNYYNPQVRNNSNLIKESIENMNVE